MCELCEHLFLRLIHEELVRIAIFTELIEQPVLPPLYSLIASDKASIDSMSKLLVGSSCEMRRREAVNQQDSR